MVLYSRKCSAQLEVFVRSAWTAGTAIPNCAKSLEPRLHLLSTKPHTEGHYNVSQRRATIEKANRNYRQKTNRGGRPSQSPPPPKKKKKKTLGLRTQTWSPSRSQSASGGCSQFYPRSTNAPQNFNLPSLAVAIPIPALRENPHDRNQGTRTPKIVPLKVSIPSMALILPFES